MAVTYPVLSLVVTIIILTLPQRLTFFAPTNDTLRHNNNAFWVTGDDDDHKHHIEKVLEDAFKYHIIPGVIESRLFGQNSTIATHLQARYRSFDMPGVALRFRAALSLRGRRLSTTMCTSLKRTLMQRTVSVGCSIR
ncbi:hypothetical protein FRB95_002282 [Tulasnella sp. JGI-2019a]|nr:hypothetical protein FRB95_002282 [Tulasnella sp. JGI-2019a]